MSILAILAEENERIISFRQNMGIGKVINKEQRKNMVYKILDYLISYTFQYHT